MRLKNIELLNFEIIALVKKIHYQIINLNKKPEEKTKIKGNLEKVSSLTYSEDYENETNESDPDSEKKRLELKNKEIYEKYLSLNSKIRKKSVKIKKPNLIPTFLFNQYENVGARHTPTNFIFDNTRRNSSISSIDSRKLPANYVFPTLNEFTTLVDAGRVDMSRRSSLGLTSDYSVNSEHFKNNSKLSEEGSTSFESLKCAFQRRKSEVLRIAEEDQFDAINQIYDKKFSRDKLSIEKTSTSSSSNTPRAIKLERIDEPSDSTI